MRVPILTLDVPNKNNRIYPKEVVGKAMEKYRQNFIKEGRALVTKRQPESSTVSIKDAIGVVKEMTVENGKVVVDIQFLPGIADALAAEAGMTKGVLHLRTSCTGTIKKTKGVNTLSKMTANSSNASSPMTPHETLR